MDDKKLIDTSWFENIYQKFETMCLEVEEAIDKYALPTRQETLGYVEKKLQTAGTNMNRFCSNIMQDLTVPFDEEEELYSSPVKDDLMMESPSKSVDQSTHVKEELTDSLSEGRDGAKNYEKMEKCVGEELINDNYSPAEVSDNVSGNTSRNLEGDIHSVECLAKSFKGEEIIITRLTPGDDLIDEVEVDAETIQPYNLAKLNESCIIVDGHGLSSVPNESRKPRYFKFSQIKFPGVFASRKSIKKHVGDQLSNISFIPSATTMKSTPIEEQISEESDCDWEMVEISSHSTEE